MISTIIAELDSRKLDHYISDLKLGFEFFKRDADFRDRCDLGIKTLEMIQAILNSGTENHDGFLTFHTVNGNPVWIDASKITVISQIDGGYELSVKGISIKIKYERSIQQLVSIILAARSK